MKRLICVSLILSVLSCLLLLSAAADGEEKFSAVIETSSDSFNIGDAFFIKVSISDLKLSDTEGFIGYQFSLKYDPNVLEVIENEDGTFAEATLPENWNEGMEKIEKLVKDADGKQSGKIGLAYIAPLDSEDLSSFAVKDDSVYVNIKFRCIAGADRTSVSFDGESGVNCTVIDAEGNVENVRGKNTSLDLLVKSEKSGSTGTIVYVAAAVAVVAAVIVVAVIVKKKKK